MTEKFLKNNVLLKQGKSKSTNKSGESRFLPGLNSNLPITIWIHKSTLFFVGFFF